mgnify:CR=1 FL=1
MKIGNEEYHYEGEWHAEAEEEEETANAFVDLSEISNDSVRMYLNEIGRINLLAAQEEVDLANEDFAKWEKVKQFRLTPDVWTIDDGHLTPTMKLLKASEGFDVQMIPSGCCGMAGSFGYEKDKYEIKKLKI